MWGAVLKAVAGGAARGGAARAAAGAGRGAAMRAGAARAVKPMGQGPLPPPKASAYNGRTGVIPAGATPQRTTAPPTAARVSPRSGVVQPAGQAQAARPPRSQQMMQAAAQSRRTSRERRPGGAQGQRYWQGQGTEVFGGMPANYDRMSIAGPRTMGVPSFGRKWQGQMTERMQAGIAAGVDQMEADRAATGRGSIVPYSGRIATGQGPLPPPRTPGRGMLPAPTSPMYQGEQTQLPALVQPGTSSAPKAGPLYRPTGDTSVSQGVGFKQPSGSNVGDARGLGRNEMFGSGVLWGEQTGTSTPGNPWNANTPGSTLTQQPADVVNARIARGRKAGANPVKVYGATLDWPKQGD